MGPQLLGIGAIAVVLLLAIAVFRYGRFSMRVEHPDRYHAGQTVYIDGRRYVITRVDGHRIWWRRA